MQRGEQLVAVNRDTRLNYRVLDIRTAANQGIFRIEGQVELVSFCFNYVGLRLNCYLACIFVVQKKLFPCHFEEIQIDKA